MSWRPVALIVAARIDGPSRTAETLSKVIDLRLGYVDRQLPCIHRLSPPLPIWGLVFINMIGSSPFLCLVAREKGYPFH